MQTNHATYQKDKAVFSLLQEWTVNKEYFYAITTGKAIVWKKAIFFKGIVSALRVEAYNIFLSKLKMLSSSVFHVLETLHLSWEN